MKRLLAPALALAGALYPFAVYWGLQQQLPMAWLALPLALLWALRAVCAPATAPGTRLLPLALVAFCLLLALGQSPAWLRAYPVLVSALLLALFAASLRGTPVVERIARLHQPDLPPEGVRYTRKVTIVWCGFFAANGLVAAALALWGNWAWWTLYNGAISYALMAALMLGEWCVRPRAAARSSDHPAV